MASNDMRTVVGIVWALVAGGCSAVGPECNTEALLSIEPTRPVLDVGETYIPRKAELARDCEATAVPVQRLRWSVVDSTVLRVLPDSSGLVAVRAGTAMAVARYVATEREYSRELLITVR